MPIREEEVAAYLRTDDALGVLVPGGIYSSSSLSVEGITDIRTTPDVWADGFQPSVIVRQRSAVPSGLLVDFKMQETDSDQVVEVYAYALDVATVESILDAVYGLMQGHAFTLAWPAEWQLTVGVIDAPELPPATRMARMDYRIKFIRRPVVA